MGRNPSQGWEDVAKEARVAQEEVHVGIVFGFVVEKNTDLPAGGPRRTFKGCGVSHSSPDELIATLPVYFRRAQQA